MAKTEKPTVNTAIAKCMHLALSGDREVVKRFFKEFLKGPLFVPQRFQAAPLTDSPKYPNPFLNILGTQSGDKVFVPVFTEPDLIEEWCGQPFKWREMTGSELINIMPEEWWICVNPGSEVNKEITPWEISKLKRGEEEIEEIIDEISFDSMVDWEIADIESGEFKELKKVLVNEAKNEPLIKKIFLVKEIAKDSSGLKRISLLAGALFDICEPETMEAIIAKLQNAGDRCQIGQETVKVLGGVSEESLNLGIFQKTNPIYEREKKL